MILPIASHRPTGIQHRPSGPSTETSHYMRLRRMLGSALAMRQSSIKPGQVPSSRRRYC